jgi:hypothetical protein
MISMSFLDRIKEMINSLNIDEEKVKRLEEVYKTLIAPTTFFILISWQYALATFANIYNLNISFPFTVGEESIRVAFHTVLYSVPTLIISIFFYTTGNLFKNSFCKITSLYFLLITLFTVGVNYVTFLLPVFIPPTPFVIYISFVLSFLLFFSLKRNWMAYLLILILDILLILIFSSNISFVILLSFLNEIIMYAYYFIFKGKVVKTEEKAIV